MELFCEYNKHLKAINYFHKKLHLRCFTSSKFIVTHFEDYCNVFDIVFAHIKQTLSLLSDVMLSKNLELLCNFMFATDTKTIIYIT